MNRVLIIEATARTAFDAETTALYEASTQEEMAERLADMKREVTQMFVRESEEGTDVNVTVRIEEVRG
jgi:hypothetical protein